MARGFGSTYGTSASANSDHLLGTGSINFGTTFSMAGWIYENATGGGGFGVPWSFYAGGGVKGFIGPFTQAAKFSFERDWSGAFAVWSVPKNPTGRYFHLAITYDGGSTSNKPRIWIDNVEQTVTTDVAPSGSLSACNQPIYIGDQTGGGFQWDGLLGNIAVWNNTLLTPEEVAALFLGESPVRVRPFTLATYAELDGVSSPEPLWPGTLADCLINVTGTRLAPYSPPVEPLSEVYSYFKDQLLMAASFTGTGAITEGADTLAASGTLLFTGSAAVTEGADALASSGKEIFTGSSSLAESADVLAASGLLAFIGSVAVTESADVLAASGKEIFTGSAAITEGADTLASSGAELFTGSAALSEGADVLAAAALSIFTGAGAATEGLDTLAASGLLTFAATAAPTEGADVLAASGLLAFASAAAIQEAADIMAATGLDLFTGAAALVESSDTLAATALTFMNMTGALAERADRLDAACVLEFDATAAIHESADALSAAVLDQFTGSAALHESADIFAASVLQKFLSAAALSESADILAGVATSVFPISSSGAMTEGADTLHASSKLSFLGTAALHESLDSLSAELDTRFGPIKSRVTSSVLYPATVYDLLMGSARTSDAQRVTATVTDQ